MENFQLIFTMCTSSPRMGAATAMTRFVRALVGRQQAQIGGQELVQAREIPIAERLDVVDAPTRSRNRAPRVCPPDIGNQRPHCPEHTR